MNVRMEVLLWFDANHGAGARAANAPLDRPDGPECSRRRVKAAAGPCFGPVVFPFAAITEREPSLCGPHGARSRCNPISVA
jgi:hypothetical protein